MPNNVLSFFKTAIVSTSLMFALLLSIGQTYLHAAQFQQPPRWQQRRQYQPNYQQQRQWQQQQQFQYQQQMLRRQQQQRYPQPGRYQQPGYKQPQRFQPTPQNQNLQSTNQSNKSNQVPFIETRDHDDFPRLAADFEPQTALVLSVSDWQPHHSPIFKQLVEKTHGHVDVLVLCNDKSQLVRLMDWIKDIPQKCDHLYFAQLELDTIWLRDFAPFIAETKDGDAQAIDFYYTGQRPKDDGMPELWAKQTGTQLKQVKWTMQGGNLLTNGKQTAITSMRVFQDNKVTFPKPIQGLRIDPIAEGRKLFLDALMEGCNLKQLVILEHLQSEATKHCDMFASFLDTNKIVVASVDARRDPVNSAILDRNARRLKSVKIDGKPLEVTRIQIPPRKGQSWSALTNIIIANDLVLVPIYKDDAPMIVNAAVKTYERLLPNHTVKTVDITTFKQLQGELHCLSMNLPAFAKMPKRITHQQMVDFIARTKSSEVSSSDKLLESSTSR